MDVVPSPPGIQPGRTLSSDGRTGIFQCKGAGVSWCELLSQPQRFLRPAELRGLCGSLAVLAPCPPLPSQFLLSFSCLPPSLPPAGALSLCSCPSRLGQHRAAGIFLASLQPGSSPRTVALRGDSSSLSLEGSPKLFPSCSPAPFSLWAHNSKDRKNGTWSLVAKASPRYSGCSQPSYTMLSAQVY